VQGTWYNQTGAAVVPQIWIYAINSGAFITSQGRSMRSVSLLDESSVLSAPSDQNVLASAHTDRIVGAGIMTWLRGAVDKAKHAYEVTRPAISGAKRLLESSGNPTAAKVSKALSSVGYGRSMGSMGSGVRTGAGGLEDRFM
jgi:hypothetical protein